MSRVGKGALRVVPTIYPRSPPRMVGTLRFAHPTQLESHRLQHDLQPIPRFWDRPHLPVGAVARLQRYAEILQEMPRKAFRLHIGKMQSEAHMRAAAERHPGEAMPVA